MPSLFVFAKANGIIGVRRTDTKDTLNERFKLYERSTVLVTNVFEETLVHLYADSFESNCMKTIKSISSELKLELTKEVRLDIKRAFRVYFEFNKPDVPIPPKRVRKSVTVAVACTQDVHVSEPLPIAEQMTDDDVIVDDPESEYTVSVKHVEQIIVPEQLKVEHVEQVVEHVEHVVEHIEQKKDDPNTLRPFVECPKNLSFFCRDGVKWYKNITKEGGAQDFLIQHMRPYENNNDNDVLIQSVTKRGRAWAIVLERKLRQLVMTNQGINETITRFPHKVYFDFDKHERDDKFLDYIIPEIKKYFPDADLSVSGSVTDAKTSYHVTVNNWLITNVEEQQAMKLIKIDHIDSCVYTKNRNMKCVNQSKPDGRIQAKVIDEDEMGHLITAYLPWQYKTVSESIVMDEYKIKKPVNLAVIPKVVSDMQLNLDAMDARAIMNATPLSPENDFAYANRILRFVRANGISYKEFLVWAHQKHEDDKKWTDQWNNTKFSAPSMESMKATLKHMYPNAVKTEDLSFVKFRNTFNIGETVKVDRLGQEHFKEGITCVNIGMGGGKTTQTIEWIKDKNYIVISPNIALGRNMTSRLPKAAFYKDIKTRTAGIKEKQLIICMNSLHYVTESYDTVVLDEIETVLNKWQGTFMRDKKEANFTAFVKLIREAKNIILLDAFLTTKTLDFIRSIRSDPITIIQRKEEPRDKTVHYVSKFQSMVAGIMDDLSNGKKVFIFYPQKGQTNNISMAGLHKLLSANGHRGVYYNSEIDEDKKKDLRDVNVSWKDQDFVITNTTITVGINYDDEAVFDKAYLFIAAYNSPRDVIQVSCRPRTLRSGQIFVHFMGRMTKPEVWLNDTAGLLPEFAPLFKNNLVEMSAPIRKTFGLFCERAGYKQIASEKDMYEHQIEKVKQLLDDHSCYYDFSSIPDIGFNLAEEYQMKIFTSTATQLEKITLAKYGFVNNFRKDMRSSPEVAAAWNGQRIKMTDGVYTGRGIFDEIAEHNNMVGLPEDLTKIKLSPELLDKIFSEFSFRSLTRTSSVSKILFNIYNDHFGPIYKSIEVSKGNRVYTLDDGVQEYYKFCVPAMCHMTCRCSNKSTDSLGLCKMCGGI